ncbi:MAG: hypothetical protein WD426_08225 [Anditalea sp.]
MRKTLRLAMLLLLFFGPLLVEAQEEHVQTKIYKPFKVDVGINLTFPASTNLSVGGGFFVEPRYSITDRLQMGLHLGSNIIGEGKYLFQNTEAIIKAQAIGNLSLTGEYQFTLENVRPFIGMTAGMYRRSDYEIIDNNNGKVINIHRTHVNFGMAPRMGIVAGKFRLNATYHFAGEGISDFVSIGLGIQFGGGKISEN